MNRKIRREFLIARAARERYGFFRQLFMIEGDRAVGDLYDARLLAARMNERLDLLKFPERTIKAGRIYAMGLIEEIYHYVIRRYVEDIAPSVFSKAHQDLEDLYGEKEVSSTLLTVVRSYPPKEVLEGSKTPEEYMRDETAGTPNSHIMIEEIILLSLANGNRAYKPFSELFDDTRLRQGRVYGSIENFFDDFFRNKPPFGPENQPLLAMLRSPSIASPDSIKGQLAYILDRWYALLSPFIAQILTSLDLIREEDRAAFAGFDGMAPVIDFQRETIMGKGYEGEDGERYTRDRDWMSSVVMIAKSVYVWLHQLSVKYGRSIVKLDQIPDEELDILASWGFNALWLIGVWERSPASREIKRQCGNPEAESSAYSLYDYTIAEDLGGRSALENLKDRSWRRGIRLAADMVPNHVGIYSRWVAEHPDWFIQSDQAPFPSYRFTGPDLSSDPSFSIYIEDGYWSRTDAAVAFKRVDNRSGQARFIYHGNDGTGLPWNDTAQLNYLIKDVREAVMRTILHVASLFPIIRFDAAMTLTKRHYQRLWFPSPGSGGDIPSRSGQGLSSREFNNQFPEEFWRSVVDDINSHAPDTLLLAEAFWLMEGFFVRTLGMHRVYNSAFMNMLKREGNADYRQTIKNVLEYDPEILKRFVNFMNNPDEDTAVAQFGKGDKYFGTAIMLATLPGLPMFGHGQVEGLTEKYGMEYRRSYYDERPDENLMRRHEKEIFPLFRQRKLFSGVKHFTLYDAFRSDGKVVEDVFAYSNRFGDDRCVVIFHNAYGSMTGWIKESAAVSISKPDGRRLERRTLAQELGLDPSPANYCLFYDAAHGLEYIRSCRDIHERGMEIMLGGYQYHVFLGFRQIRDTKGEWSELNRFLGGRGVQNLEVALRELFLTPLLDAFREFFNPAYLSGFVDSLYRTRIDEKVLDAALGAWEEKIRIFLDRCRDRAAADADIDALARKIIGSIRLAAALVPSAPGREEGAEILKHYLKEACVPSEFSESLDFWRLVLAYSVLGHLGELVAGKADPRRSAVLLEEWFLNKEMERVFRELGADEETVLREVLLLKILVGRQDWFRTTVDQGHDLSVAVENLLSDPDVQKYIGVNRYRDTIWFIKERFEECVNWLCIAASLNIYSERIPGEPKTDLSVPSCFSMAETLKGAAERSGFMIEKLIWEIQKGPLQIISGGKKRVDQ